MIAFILVISREPPSCSSFNLMSDLLELEAVKEAHVVFGQYDLIVKVEVDNADELAKIIVEDIGSRECVAKTMTLIVTP